ncbi:VOC family protein [Pantoea sp. App145]|uniref:VOC family protein n=1 Tax=Pantoea sp. App145 TaxID=3071567 RepID=UPI003A80B415
MQLQPDHIVINNHNDLAAIGKTFAALGFTLTPESFHTLGSINQLVMFEDHYLELIGVPGDGRPIRQELLDSTRGIDGLVFRTQDAEATECQLVELGYTVQPVQHFSRQVEFDGKWGEARFSTTRLKQGSFAAGRVYFCQHHTPELVWREPWLDHANGVKGIDGLIVVSQQPQAEQQDWLKLGILPASFHISVLDPDTFESWSAGLISPNPGRRSQFLALSFDGGRAEVLIAGARQLSLPWQQVGNRLLIALPDVNALLEFKL